MKLLALSLLASFGSSAALVHTGVLPCPCERVMRCSGISECHGTSNPVDAALTGDYIDARDCTVFGGACHVNGEVDSQGRSALVAWRLDAGGTVVAAVEADSNLGRPNGGPMARRRAVLFIDGVQDAVVSRLAASAGLEVVASHAKAVTWQRTGDEFKVGVEGLVELAGTALADRSCCTMPNLVWYRPLASASVLQPTVGNPSRCHFAGADGDGLQGWRYDDANTVLLGRFELTGPGSVFSAPPLTGPGSVFSAPPLTGPGSVFSAPPLTGPGSVFSGAAPDGAEG